MMIGKRRKKNKECRFINVYTLSNDLARRNLWDELIMIIRENEVLWCLGGDFNIVKLENERIGRGNVSRLATPFREFIVEMALVDLPLIREKYMCCGFREGCVFSRLDCFLIDMERLQSEQKLILKCLLSF
ncbi:Uncharacterized protein TCM_033712 [Theobroma cacao]|uniref:Uncharacterized protein n=1 Tax=Theobroma cacao TaxID=3641 RepID=A0A061FC90_THECC|nr:Uncharacterized protein TCM_033712 [Theobroma cacao]